METQHTTSCNLSLVINREQERIGIDIHRYRVTRVITGKNLSHRGIEIQLVEQQIQHRNKLVRFATIHDDVGRNWFYDAAPEINQHGWRNRRCLPVHNAGAQHGMPILIHHVEELGALDRITKLDVASRPVIRFFKDRRVKGKVLKGRIGNIKIYRAVRIQQAQRNRRDLCRNRGPVPCQRMVSNHGEIELRTCKERSLESRHSCKAEDVATRRCALQP